MDIKKLFNKYTEEEDYGCQTCSCTCDCGYTARYMNEERFTQAVDEILSNRFEQQVIPKIAEAIKEIVWMARRYADGRQTFSARSFNDAYDVLRDVFGEGIEFTKYKDLTLTEDGAFFPYAQDGGDRKYFDAVRDRKYSNFSE